MAATKLWEAQFGQLLQRKGGLHLQLTQLQEQLAVVDKQLAALDMTKGLAEGLDTEGDKAKDAPGGQA